MNLFFIKINFILFEIVSLVMTLLILVGLIYYTILFKYRSGMKSENQVIIQINYEVSQSSQLYSGVDLKINYIDKESNLNGNGYIVYNKQNFINKTEKAIIEDINASDPDNIFIFNSKATTERFLTNLINQSSNTNDFINSAILFVVNIFVIFMKITLIRISIKQIKEIKSNKNDPNKIEDIFTQLTSDNSIHPILSSDGSVDLGDDSIMTSNNLPSSNKPEERNNNNQNNNQNNKPLPYNPLLTLLNPRNFFNFCIFHISTIIIIPTLYPNLTDYYVGKYMGFSYNLFQSVYFGRTYIGQSSFNSLSEIVYTENPFPKRYFLIHTPMTLNSLYVQSLNPYLINLGYLICAVWVSQYFKPFDQSKITINDRVKPTKWKKVINILVPVVIFAFWGVFLGWGLVNVGEFLYLFHAEIFFSFKKIIDVKILFFLICLYYHICFYILMGLYTWRVKYKNKKSIK